MDGNQDWKQRVLNERADLSGKVQRLADFITLERSGFRKLPTAEKNRLRRQLEAMLDYKQILEERIDSDFQ